MSKNEKIQIKLHKISYKIVNLKNLNKNSKN